MVIARQIVGGQGVNVVRTIRLERTRTDNNLVTYALDYTPDETARSTWRCASIPAIRIFRIAWILHW